VSDLNVLVIGGLTKDLIKRKSVQSRPGGGAFYCSIAAARMGASVELWTVVGDEFPKEGIVQIESEGVRVVQLRSTSSIGFVNEIDEVGHRRQWVSSVADRMINVPLGPLNRFDYVQITPVLGEVDPKVISAVPPGLTGVEMQGFLRKREIGPVRMIHPSEMDELLKMRLLVHLSEDELLYFTDSTISEELQRHSIGAIALTRSAKGSFIFSRTSSYFVPAPRIRLIDDVGCGDVYSVTMGISLADGRPPLEAAITATSAATLLAESTRMERLRRGEDFEKRVSLVRDVYQKYGLASKI